MSFQPLQQLARQLNNTPIVFVGGKGGVGKTTTAAALAVNFATQDQRTLLISTDPAHSLGDIFSTKLGHQKTALHEQLDIIELDPEIIIDQHFAQVERTISGYANPEMMPKIQAHLKLSKTAPGAQEAAMLESICKHLVDAVAAGYEHVIFDTAPTGHTLRLLVLPEMMEAWTDGLLTQQRRQAKLKSAADHLSTATQKSQLTNPFEKAGKPDRWQQAVEVLSRRKQLFSAAGNLLHDKEKTAVILVMTADTLPIEETRRATEQLKSAQLTPAAIVVNQLIQPEQSDDFWQQRATRQQKLLAEIEQIFSDYPRYQMYLQQTDIRGFAALQAITAQ